MKKYDLVTVATVVFIALVLPVLAGSDGVHLRYRWLPSKSYTYRYTHRAGVEGKESAIFQDDLLITVLGQDDLIATLALRGLGVENFIEFVSVDQFGRPTRKAYFVKLTNNFADGKNMQVFEEASRALTMYNKLIWELPSQPIPCNMKSRGPYGDNMYCFMQTNICVMENVDETGVKKDQTSKRLFDTENGRLLEHIEICGQEFNGFVLEGINSISEQEQKLLKEQYGESIDIDEFREKIFKPYAIAEDPRIRHAVYYSRLAEIQDEERLCRIWKEFMHMSENQADFQQFVKPVLLNNISKGRRWSLQLLIQEDLVALGHDKLDKDGKKLLSKLSGLNQAVMDKSKSAWFETIKKALPDFGNTPSHILIQETTNKHSWVRLFALKQLAAREGVAPVPTRYRRRSPEWPKVDLLPIFEKASGEQDDTVREFAAVTLKILRGDAEKEATVTPMRSEVNGNPQGQAQPTRLRSSR